jgi:hypothetical protein
MSWRRLAAPVVVLAALSCRHITPENNAPQNPAVKGMSPSERVLRVFRMGGPPSRSRRTAGAWAYRRFDIGSRTPVKETRRFSSAIREGCAPRGGRVR